ncbi:helix-turn-helix domain-containing protein [Caballeronia grimmiae]|uniref:helix-turn-helix domain-containing protein n=1 Tax=Caballeronia grimmiae TaxID=1071679 RepID=UPI0035315653
MVRHHWRSEQEKHEFAKRLLLSIAQRGLRGPTALARLCNSRDANAEVTPQSAFRWLSGAGMPSVASMKLLAQALDVDLEWLRSGAERNGMVRSSEGATRLQRLITLLREYRTLTAAQKDVIVTLVATFSGSPQQREADFFMTFNCSLRPKWTH